MAVLNSGMIERKVRTGWDGSPDERAECGGRACRGSNLSKRRSVCSWQRCGDREVALRAKTGSLPAA
eukprot:scaffold42937_cov45-Prasinocladus_malaysianus.AAC.2